MNDWQISIVDPSTAEVGVLLERHLEFVNELSPAADVHALDLAGLLRSELTLFGFWSGGALLGIGGLLQLDADTGELKSMHTGSAARGRGVGSALLAHLIATARERGLTRLFLETGTAAAFAPAHSLYARAGFVACPAFGPYRPSTYSRFMSLPLRPAWCTTLVRRAGQ